MRSSARSGRVVPVFGCSAFLHNLLSGLLGRRGCLAVPVESIFELIEMTHKASPRIAFVSLEKLIDWNQDGLVRLRNSSMFTETDVVPFSETWQRHELPEVSGLDSGNMLFVPFAIDDLERILDRYPLDDESVDGARDELAS